MGVMTACLWLQLGEARFIAALYVILQCCGLHGTAQLAADQVQLPSQSVVGVAMSPLHCLQLPPGFLQLPV